MEFSDIYLNSEDFFEILTKAWENSEFFDGWDKKWHPEDLTSNIEVVFDGVVQGIVAYSDMIGRNIRASKGYSPNKKTVNDMNIQKQSSELASERVQVFGGTLPTDYRHPRTSVVPPSYAGNSVFGDNV